MDSKHILYAVSKGIIMQQALLELISGQTKAKRLNASGVAQLRVHPSQATKDTSYSTAHDDVQSKVQWCLCKR